MPTCLHPCFMNMAMHISTPHAYMRVRATGLRDENKSAAACCQETLSASKCADMCIDICIEMCIDLCIDMRIDMRIAMCMEMCAGAFRDALADYFVDM